MYTGFNSKSDIDLNFLISKKVFSEWSISDVETGIFLSSGLDSNLINTLIHQDIDISTIKKVVKILES